MSLKNQTLIHLNELMQKWKQLQEIPNIFSYRLNVSESKYLPGKHRFYSELNRERTALRRAPQTILSLHPTFDEEKFNFKKINPQECIMTLTSSDRSTISMIINKSPLTRYHTLICPNVHLGLAQHITMEALRFCVEFLLSLVEENERNFRIGYNSPGALASVNHLHLHLMFIDKDLYIDHVKLDPLSPPDIYRLDKAMPTEAICFLFKPDDTNHTKEAKLQNLNQFLQWLCDNNMPHNIFMTPECNETKGKLLKVFIYARQEYCIIKELNTYNIGFCELSGYVPVGTQHIYDHLNETDVIQKINQETGDVFSKIYNYFNGK